MINNREGLESWLKKKENVALLAVMLLALVLSLYYSSVTSNQPLWWDESDYLAYSKTVAGIGSGDWIVTTKHNTLFVYAVAGMFLFGFSESLIRFLLEILPFLLVVFLSYKIVMEMYKDYRLATIASFLLATSWVFLFNAMRFHVDVPSLLFGLLAIYFFWRGYENKEKVFGIDSKWAVPLAALFVIICYGVRRGYFLFGIFLLVYVLMMKNPKEFIKDKFNWIAFGLSVVLIWIMEKFVFSSPLSQVSTGYVHTESPLNLIVLHVFQDYFSNIQMPLASILLYLFWIGFVFMVAGLVLSFGFIKKQENFKRRADLFFLITIIVTMSFFFFILRVQTSAGEPRWFFPMILGCFVAIGRAILPISEYLKKYGKQISVIFIVLILGFGGYYEISHADFIIKNKVGTFEGIKDAGLYLKNVANESDLIIVAPQPQASYYSERRVIHPSKLAGWNESGATTPFDLFLSSLEKTPEAKYLIVTFSEPNHPEWMQKITYAQSNGQTVMAKWEIPFMETSVDFTTGAQDIKPGIQYSNGIGFKLLTIKEDAFVYEITRD